MIPRYASIAYYVALGGLIGYAVAGPYGYPGWGFLGGAVLMFLFELHVLISEHGLAREIWVDWRLRKQNPLKRLWLEFYYRAYDPDVCCCGSYIGQGGDICKHGGCRSMKEYVITESMKEKQPTNL